MPVCGELHGGRHDDLDGRLTWVGCGSPGILEVTDGIPAAERPWVGGAGSITAMRTAVFGATPSFGLAEDARRASLIRAAGGADAPPNRGPGG